MAGIVGRVADELPTWASFMNAREYRDFRSLVDAWLSAHGHGFRDAPGGVVELESDDGPRQLGLINLAQICHLSPRSDWTRVVGEHLENSLSADLNEGLPLENARPLLRVRLYPEGMEHEDALLGRRLAPGLLAVPVIDSSRTIRAVMPPEAEEWGTSLEQLLEIGLANVKTRERPDYRPPGRDQFGMLIGQSFYVSTWLMMLEEYLNPVPRHGALVMAPMRHVLCFEPIRDLSIVETMPDMQARAIDLFESGPGSVSPYLYWWRPGRLEALPMRRDGDLVIVQPHQEIVDLLASLPAAARSTPTGRRRTSRNARGRGPVH